jgi:hypothetical protein
MIEMGAADSKKERTGGPEEKVGRENRRSIWRMCLELKRGMGAE